MMEWCKIILLFLFLSSVTKECTTPHKLGLQLVGDFYVFADALFFSFLCIIMQILFPSFPTQNNGEFRRKKKERGCA